MEPEFNHYPDLFQIKQIANAQWVGARILWNLGLFFPALQLLHESIEKYLKVIWARKKKFKNKTDFKGQLRRFGHDIVKIFEALQPEDKKLLKTCLNKYGLRLYYLENLRYGSDGAILYNEAWFRAAEKLISLVRQIIGDKIEKNILESYKHAAHPDSPRRNEKRENAVKLILGAQRYTPTKKMRKEQLRKFKVAVNKLKSVK